MSPDQCAQPTETVTSSTVPAASIGRPLDSGAQPLRRAQGARLVGVGQDRDELVAAPAGQLIARAHPGGQPARDLDQHLVARLVAVGVVDRLEVVDVDVHQREQSAVAHAQRDLALQLVRAVAAVRELRQVVGERLAREPPVGLAQRVVQPLDT